MNTIEIREATMKDTCLLLDLYLYLASHNFGLPIISSHPNLELPNSSFFKKGIWILNIKNAGYGIEFHTLEGGDYSEDNLFGQFTIIHHTEGPGLTLKMWRFSRLREIVHEHYKGIISIPDLMEISKLPAWVSFGK